MSEHYLLYDKKSRESVDGNLEVAEMSVMVHDVRDIIEDIDKQICKVRSIDPPHG